MTDVYADTPPLTPAQRAVVELPADAYTLVTAGAGAGKTHTLVRRLDFLVAEEELSAGEILVLTFSRAAVRELRSRLARHGDAARHVRTQTFDSWALDLVMQVDAEGDWQHRSFDARIDGARQAIDDGLAEELYGEDLRHVIIDEVQDLVGKRRELVEALLDEFGCGFTVVGDPAQSIYGFTVKDPEQRPKETNYFFDWLRTYFADDLVELTLDENFRARTDDARTALPFGPRLRRVAEGSRRSSEELHDELRSALMHPERGLGDLDALACTALADYEGTTAVLCRNNGEALVVSEILHGAGVPHRLQRSARDRVAPAWLEALFRAVDGSVITRVRFDELVPTLSIPAGLSPEETWRLLRRTGRGQGNDRSLDLGRLRTALAAGRLPDELTGQPPARLVISSFHRAKGLEFDRVVVVDPGPLRNAVPQRPKNDKGRSKKPREIDVAEEARLLYVAMTRPREELLWLNTLDMQSIRVDRELDRLARYSFQYWARRGFELIGGDVFTDQPAGMRDFEGDVVELQEYLATKVSPGDEVVVERLSPDAIASGQSPPYLITHGGRPIGAVSDQFREHLYRHLKVNSGFEPWNWPLRLTGVRVDAIETVAGSEAAGARSGLGPYGVWLAPRLMGLSTFDWDKNTKEADSDVTV
ncbi:ATP-dependent helicase [Actinoallomurus sp. NPDC050550]|uniref:ATP-dependent helicase n=1 Tax=Actinoallomurus sp. NPDC050550 TaxID=3154937 RepID=UPI00340F9A9C